MMENLNIQFVYPNYELPTEWKKEIESIDHIKIKPLQLFFKDNDTGGLCSDKIDVAVINNWEKPTETINIPLIIRTNKDDFFTHYCELMPLLQYVPRINVILDDIETFTDENFEEYNHVLQVLADQLEKLYLEGNAPQLNLLTDRMMLSDMNNCGAGDTTITLAPNGRFYVCPAFFYEDEADSIGDLEHGIDIKNKFLYKLDYAPLCHHCDAWQCKRCIWLNRKMTLEVNTPSHEQCVIAHLERNISRNLLRNIRAHGTFLPDTEIKEITYLDPFEEIYQF